MVYKSCFDSALDISLMVISWALISLSLFPWEKFVAEASVTILTNLSMLWVWQGQLGTSTSSQKCEVLQERVGSPWTHLLTN